MGLWLVRGGKFGEYEEHFLSAGEVNLTWEGLQSTDLSVAKDYEAIRKIVFETYPDQGARKLGNWAGQIWAFVIAIDPGDWVVLPRKFQGSIAIGEVTSDYEYVVDAEPMRRHVRRVRWLNTEIPRSVFDQDILYSFGAFLTVCKIQRNDAEARVRALAKASWKSQGVAGALSVASPSASPSAPEPDESVIDLERIGADQIAQLIERRFKGHGLARLVAAILNAQGYQTHVSAEGPDKGIDILAAPDPLGFGSPRICIQVKSGDAPVDRPTLDQLIGVMQNVNAQQGLLVAWGGFKNSVTKDISSQFFRVRLWDADALVEQILAQYERLPVDIRAELPLKRVWTVALDADEE